MVPVTRRLLRGACILGVAATIWGSKPIAAQDAEAPDCTELPRCIELIEAHRLPPPSGDSGVAVQPIARILERLPTFGDPAVEALVPLLSHPHSEVRKRAAFALRRFERIDPRHLPALIDAYRRGETWLPVAIAATGSDDALRFLQQEFSRDEGDDQVTFAIARFGRRAEPFLVERLMRCRTGCPYDVARRALSVLGELGPMPQGVDDMVRELALSARTEPKLKRMMQDHLIAQHSPEGLNLLLGELDAAAAKPESDFDASLALVSLGRFGPAARAAGPRVRPFLARTDWRRARTEAALALGRIGDAEAVPALIALLDEADRDWLLAYNAVEALALLRADGARPRIQALADGHWFKPVRNNARRALNLLSGGEFALPELPRGADVEPEYLSLELRYAADQAAPERDCGFAAADATLDYSQNGLQPLPRPPSGHARLNLLAPAATLPARYQRSIRELAFAHDVVAFLHPFPAGRLLGTNAGEFGGGVYLLDPGGWPTLLVGDNAQAAFRLDGGTFVATGLAHGISDHGFLWRLEGEGPGGVHVSQAVRLPGKPREFAVSSDGSLLIRTEPGDVAIGPDGRPRAPTCTGG